MGSGLHLLLISLVAWRIQYKGFIWVQLHIAVQLTFSVRCLCAKWKYPQPLSHLSLLLTWSILCGLRHPSMALASLHRLCRYNSQSFPNIHGALCWASLICHIDWPTLWVESSAWSSLTLHSVWTRVLPVKQPSFRLWSFPRTWQGTWKPQPCRKVGIFFNESGKTQETQFVLPLPCARETVVSLWRGCQGVYSPAINIGLVLTLKSGQPLALLDPVSPTIVFFLMGPSDS